MKFHKSGVYLLHFDTPLHHARHYIGYAGDIDSRLALHRAGGGARILAVCVERGITWRLVRTWPGTRQTERALKRQKHAPRLCPVCNPAVETKLSRPARNRAPHAA
jgi:predicted GIY-YIG superfamily endonuclease